MKSTRTPTPCTVFASTVSAFYSERSAFQNFWDGVDAAASSMAPSHGMVVVSMVLRTTRRLGW